MSVTIWVPPPDAMVVTPWTVVPITPPRSPDWRTGLHGAQAAQSSGARFKDLRYLRLCVPVLGDDGLERGLVVLGANRMGGFAAPRVSSLPALRHAPR